MSLRLLSRCRHRAAQHRRFFQSKVEKETITAEDADQALQLDYDDDDTTSAGHLMLREHRQTLHYLRLIEHDIPRLVGMPFSWCIDVLRH